MEYQPIVNYYNKDAGLEKEYHALGRNSNGHELYVGIVPNDSNAYPVALVEVLARDEAKGELVSASMYNYWQDIRNATEMEYGRYTRGEHRQWQVGAAIFGELKAWVAKRMESTATP